MKKPTYEQLVAYLEDSLAELESSLDMRLGIGEHPQSGDMYDIKELVTLLPQVIKAAKRESAESKGRA